MNSLKASAFLTKEGIIREFSTQIDCPTDNKQIEFENENKDFSKNENKDLKKNNLITIAKRNETETEINFENFNSLEILYERFVNKSYVKMILDFIVFLFIICFMLIAPIRNRECFSSLIWRIVKNKFNNNNTETTGKMTNMNNRNSIMQTRFVIPLQAISKII